MILNYLLGISIPLILIAISGHVIWKSTNSFELAADYLGRKMSHGVKGATINAVASSMPEFLTTLFFVFFVRNEGEFVDSFSGGLGVVAGSAIFNILIIPVAVIFFGSIGFRSKNFQLDKKVIRRDGLFLLLSNVVLILLVSQRKLDALDGFILILIYLFYLFLLRKGFGFRKADHPDDQVFEVEKVPLRPVHFLRLDVKQVLLNGKRLTRANAWTTLLVSTLIMSIGSWMLVKGSELLGHDTYSLGFVDKIFNAPMELHGLNLPIIFISVLLAAAATSIPDTMISVRDARKGNHDDSISNALGSNIFDISFALGLPLLLYTLIHGELEMSRDIRILSVGSWLIMWAINLVVIPLFYFSRKITRGIGLLLLLLYLVFIVMITTEVMKAELVSDHIGTFLDFVNRILGS
jgi:cation:H+ antiporter